MPQRFPLVYHHRTDSMNAIAKTFSNSFRRPLVLKKFITTGISRSVVQRCEAPWLRTTRSLNVIDTLSMLQRHFSSGAGIESDEDFKPKKKQVPNDEEELMEMLKKQVEENKLLVYMKGTPSAPQCGFSMQVVRILHSQGVDFSSINVLNYPTIREGIKKFSDWPTIPQVYLNGEFIGGCDIIIQLHQSGELKTMLTKAGLLEA